MALNATDFETVKTSGFKGNLMHKLNARSLKAHLTKLGFVGVNVRKSSEVHVPFYGNEQHPALNAIKEKSPLLRFKNFLINKADETITRHGGGFVRLGTAAKKFERLGGGKEETLGDIIVKFVPQKRAKVSEQ